MLYVLYVWPLLDCCILTRSNFHSIPFVSSSYPSSDGAPKNADKLFLFLAFSPSLPPPPPSPCSVAFKDIPPPNRFFLGTGRCLVPEKWSIPGHTSSTEIFISSTGLCPKASTATFWKRLNSGRQVKVFPNDGEVPNEITQTRYFGVFSPLRYLFGQYLTNNSSCSAMVNFIIRCSCLIAYLTQVKQFSPRKSKNNTARLRNRGCIIANSDAACFIHRSSPHSVSAPWLLSILPSHRIDVSYLRSHSISLRCA